MYSAEHISQTQKRSKGRHGKNLALGINSSNTYPQDCRYRSVLILSRPFHLSLSENIAATPHIAFQKKTGYHPSATQIGRKRTLSPNRILRHDVMTSFRTSFLHSEGIKSGFRKKKKTKKKKKKRRVRKLTQVIVRLI